MIQRLQLLVMLGLALAGTVAAQPEIVPAEHPVYAYLLAERVAGRLPTYRHEYRPTDRATIQQHLDVLTGLETELSAGSKRWLALYRQEFFEPEGALEEVFGAEGIRLPRGRDTEKFFYHFQDDTWRFAWEMTGQLSTRSARDSVNLSGSALSGEIVLQGNYRNRIGFYSRTFNGVQFSGQPRVLQRDPALRPLYYPVVQPDDGQFDQSSASVRASNGLIFAEIAQQRLRVGAGFGDGLLLAAEPDYFPFVHAGVTTRRVDYTFMHGALGSRPNPWENPDSPGQGGILGGPERYVALHRLAVHPIPALSFAFTEMIVYANRSPELTYLIPVNPFKTAEHSEYDQDNPLFALEMTARPLRGVEMHGTILVDDANLGLIGRNSYSNKFAFQAGIGVSRGDALGFVEYTRVDPFVYTHRFFRQGEYYNAFTHYGFGLGHPIGPNADQLAAGTHVWLSGRVQAALTIRYNRRGEDYVGPDGQLVVVGGDINNGRQPPFEDRTKRLLGGDRYEGIGGRLEASWEPIRDLALFKLYADYQAWDRTADVFFLRGALVFTL